MINRSSRNQNAVLYIIDILVLGVSCLLGLLIRYGSLRVIPAWQRQLYVFLITLFLFAYTLVFLLYRRNRIRLTSMDPFENLVLTGHNTVFLAVIILFALFVANMNSLSRIAIIIILFLYFCLDFAARILFRRFLFTRHPADPVIKALLVTTREEARTVIRHFRDSALEGRGIVFTGVALLDAGLKGSEMEGVPVTGDADDLEMLGRSTDFDMVLFHLPEAGAETIRKNAEAFLDAGKDVDISINYSGHGVTADMLQDIGRYETLHLSALNDRCRVLGVDFRVTNVDEAVLYVCSHKEALKGRYICFSNSHTAVMSRENSSYRDVQNRAALVFADGTPVVRVQRKKGYYSAERVAGPDFMDAMFRASMDGSVTHYFYGSTPENIALLEKKLPERYPGIVIKGLYSPPFRAVTEEEDREDVERINSAGADIVWIGLGAPKQENWMAAHEGKIHSIMIGVGAGFDFYAGTVQRAPKWVQQIGFEWLYRLFQDPKRLIRRYVVTNFRFIMYSLLGKHE